MCPHYAVPMMKRNRCITGQPYDDPGHIFPRSGSGAQQVAGAVRVLGPCNTDLAADRRRCRRWLRLHCLDVSTCTRPPGAPSMIGVHAIPHDMTRRGFLTARLSRALSPEIVIGPSCFAKQNVVCQSCADACAVAAIRFWPQIDKPPFPEVVADDCTCCGDCLSACPIAAITMTACRGEQTDV